MIFWKKNGTFNKTTILNDALKILKEKENCKKIIVWNTRLVFLICKLKSNKISLKREMSNKKNHKNSNNINFF